jgi:hypothetical protein
VIPITGQIPEEIYYRHEIYKLTGMKGGGLYIPEHFGISTYWKSTGCYRGFQMRYRVFNKELLLDRMKVNTKQVPPPINGIKPQRIRTRYASFDFGYDNLNLKSKFTGRLLIGKDFIRSMYVHMGFQKPKTFKTVLELHVDDGNVTEIKDRSKDVESIRKREELHKRRDPYYKYSKGSPLNFIDDSFSLDYYF